MCFLHFKTLVVFAPFNWPFVGTHANSVYNTVHATAVHHRNAATKCETEEKFPAAFISKYVCSFVRKIEKVKNIYRDTGGNQGESLELEVKVLKY